MTKQAIMARAVLPANDYDTEAWMAFYAANPGYRRSLSAAATEEGGEGGEGDEGQQQGDQKPGEEQSKPGEGEGEQKPKVSDREAELLRESMKRKETIRELNDKLKLFDGIDPNEVRTLLEERQQQQAQQQERETQEALARGEFDRVKQQILDQAKAREDELSGTLSEKDQAIAALQNQIVELTVGSSFSSSKFLAETVLTPSKARRLYGDHFEVEGGKIVPYDKPKGANDRTPLVDGRGEPLGFDAAMKRIIEADEDRDQLLRASIRPGSDADPKKVRDEKTTKAVSSMDKISAGLGDLIANVSSGPKLG